MSDGLDFELGDPDGLPIQHMVSMLYSFASVQLAEELHSDAYPIVSSLWGYHGTAIEVGQIPTLRAEIINLINALSKERIGQTVIDELDSLLLFIKGAERLGLGLNVQGP